MSDFIEQLKTDRIFQIGFIIFFISIFFLFLIFKSVFFPKKSNIPCYETTLIIWMPFKEHEIYPYLADFISNYCVTFEIKTKSIEEIKRDLPYALASNEAPDIVYIDNSFLNRYPVFFNTSTPLIVDALVAYYNKDIINLFNVEKPKDFDKLQSFINTFRNYRHGFYPLALGTDEIRNRKEILLSLYSLNEGFQDKSIFWLNFISAIKIYKDFSNIQSNFFSYMKGAGDDLTNFANQKLALYIGFYQDKKEILKINPRINISFDLYPLNYFPPRTKIYSKIFYLASTTKNNYKKKAVQHFISSFKDYKLKDFSNDFDLVPFVEYEDLSQDKKTVLNSVKNFGETFDFLNKEILFNNIDRILEADERELNKIFNEIYYLL